MFVDSVTVTAGSSRNGPGHKFQDRVGHGVKAQNNNEYSQVFLQFLDCVWQLMNMCVSGHDIVQDGGSFPGCFFEDCISPRPAE